VKIVRAGVKKPWWRPIEDELLKAVAGKRNGKGNPLAGALASDTGEGTRYGRRAKRPDKKHVTLKRRRPQQ
jgi:hypothetical protein